MSSLNTTTSSPPTQDAEEGDGYPLAGDYIEELPAFNGNFSEAKYNALRKKVLAMPSILSLLDRIDQYLAGLTASSQNMLKDHIHKIVDAVFAALWERVENAAAAQRQAQLEQDKLSIAKELCEEECERSKIMQAKYIQELSVLRDEMLPDRSLDIRICDQLWNPIVDLDEGTRRLVTACAEEQLKGNWVCSNGEVFAEKEAKLEGELVRMKAEIAEKQKSFQDVQRNAYNARRALLDMETELARTQTELEAAKAAAAADRLQLRVICDVVCAETAAADRQENSSASGPEHPSAPPPAPAEQVSAPAEKVPDIEQRPEQKPETAVGEEAPLTTPKPSPAQQDKPAGPSLSELLSKQVRVYKKAKSKYLDFAKGDGESKGFRRRASMPEGVIRRGSVEGSVVADEECACDVVQLKSTELSLPAGAVGAGKAIGSMPMRPPAARGIGWRRSESRDEGGAGGMGHGPVLGVALDAELTSKPDSSGSGQALPAVRTPQGRSNWRRSLSDDEAQPQAQEPLEPAMPKGLRTGPLLKQEMRRRQGEQQGN